MWTKQLKNKNKTKKLRRKYKRDQKIEEHTRTKPHDAVVLHHVQTRMFLYNGHGSSYPPANLPRNLSVQLLGSIQFPGFLVPLSDADEAPHDRGQHGEYEDQVRPHLDGDCAIIVHDNFSAQRGSLATGRDTSSKSKFQYPAASNWEFELSPACTSRYSSKEAFSGSCYPSTIALHFVRRRLLTTPMTPYISVGRTL